MSSSRILFPQFRDEQSESKYPFADHTTLTSTTTGFKIPKDLFVDASFFGVGAAVNVYLSSIIVTTQTITITVGDVTAEKKFTATYLSATPPDNGVLKFTDSLGRPAGILVSAATKRDSSGTIQAASPLVDLAAWPAVEHKFSAATAEFVSSVVIPAREPGVRALTTENTTTAHTGDIWLIGNGGIVLRVEDENTVRVDVVGVPLFKRFVCVGQTSFPPKNFLKTINGCGPDEFGNFTFTATRNLSHIESENPAHPVMRIYPAAGALNFDTLSP